jgi:hypothetical protein
VYSREIQQQDRTTPARAEPNPTPQRGRRPCTGGLPIVRIEGVWGSNPHSSTMTEGPPGECLTGLLAVQGLFRESRADLLLGWTVGLASGFDLWSQRRLRELCCYGPAKRYLSGAALRRAAGDTRPLWPVRAAYPAQSPMPVRPSGRSFPMGPRVSGPTHDYVKAFASRLAAKVFDR